MKYLIFTILFLLGIAGFAYAARFDFTNGQPAVVEDGVLTTDSFEQSRKDFTNGQPTIAFDATATETAAAGPIPNPTVSVQIQNGTIIIRNGTLIIR